MVFVFILATSLTAISEEKKTKSMCRIPDETSRASLLEIIVRQRAKAFIWMSYYSMQDIYIIKHV